MQFAFWELYSPLVCVLSDIKFEVCVRVCVCVFCPGTGISATATPTGVNVCTTVDLSSGQLFSPFGDDIFRGFHNAGS